MRLDESGSITFLGLGMFLVMMFALASFAEAAENMQNQAAAAQAAEAGASASAMQSARTSNLNVTFNATLGAFKGLRVAMKSIESYVTCGSNIATAICAACSCPGCCGCCAACPPAQILESAEQFTKRVTDFVDKMVMQIETSVNTALKSIDTKIQSIIQDIGLDVIKEKIQKAVSFIYDAHAMIRNASAELIAELMMDGLAGEIPDEVFEGLDKIKDGHSLFKRMMSMNAASALDTISDAVDFVQDIGSWLSLEGSALFDGIGAIAGTIGDYIGTAMEYAQEAIGAIKDFIGQFDQIFALIGFFWNFNLEKLLCLIVGATVGAISDAVLWPIRMFCKLAGESISSALSNVVSGCASGSNDVLPCSEDTGVPGGCLNGSPQLAQASYVRAEETEGTHLFDRLTNWLTGRDEGEIAYGRALSERAHTAVRNWATGTPDGIEAEERAWKTYWISRGDIPHPYIRLAGRD